MNKIVITSDATFCYVVYHDFAQRVQKVKLRISEVRSLSLSTDDSFCEIIFSGGVVEDLDWTYIDNVNGTAVTSGSQFYDLLDAIFV